MLCIECFSLYLYSIKVHTAGHFDAITICRVPPDVMKTGRHLLVNQRADFPSQDIIHDKTIVQSSKSVKAKIRKDPTVAHIWACKRRSFTQTTLS